MEEKKYSFVATQTPNLKINLGNGIRVEFKNAVFHTTDAKLGEGLLNALKKNPALGAQFRPMDYEGAARLAEVYKNALRDRGAFKGPTSASIVRNTVSSVELLRKEQELLQSGATPEQLNEMRKEFAEQGLVLTSSAEGEVIRNVDLKTEQQPTEDEKKAVPEPDAKKSGIAIAKTAFASGKKK